MAYTQPTPLRASVRVHHGADDIEGTFVSVHATQAHAMHALDAIGREHGGKRETSTMLVTSVGTFKVWVV